MKKISVSESESKTETFIKELERHKQRRVSINTDEGTVQGTFVKWNNPHREYHEALIAIDGQCLMAHGDGFSISEPIHSSFPEDKIVFLDGEEPPPAFYVSEDAKWRFSTRLPSFHGYVTSQPLGILPDEAELIFNLFKGQKKKSHLISSIVISYQRRLSEKAE